MERLLNVILTIIEVVVMGQWVKLNDTSEMGDVELCLVEPLNNNNISEFIGHIRNYMKDDYFKDKLADILQEIIHKEIDARVKF